MLKTLGILCVCALLSACSVFNLNNNKNDDRIARCHEIKHQMMFNSATNDQLVEANQVAQMDSLERDYRKLGC